MRYDNGLTVREARQRYFHQSGFNTNGYKDRWVRLPVGPLAVYLPNLKGRKECIAIHDLDHVVTEYDTDWRGELQVAGFEIGVGCGRYWFGWMVNSQGIALGVLLHPRDIFRAYLRGRRCTGSLFSLRQVDDTVLEKTMGSLREEMGLDRADATPAWGDRLLFAASVLLAFVANTAPLVGFGWLVYWAVT